MRITSVIVGSIALAASVAARAVSGRDVTTEVVLVAPSQWNSTVAFPRCSILTLKWRFGSSSITDDFNIFVTNINVTAPVSTTSTSATTSSSSSVSTITTATTSIQSHSGSNPTAVTSTTLLARSLFRRNETVNLEVLANQKVAVATHQYDWQAVVPEGWYKLHGESTDPASTTTFQDSELFYVLSSNSSCGTETTTTISSTSSATSTGSSSSSSSHHPAVVAGAVIGSLAAVVILAGLFFFVFLRRKNAGRNISAPRAVAASAWGHVGSQDRSGGSNGGLRGLPVGTPNRLSRNAEAMVPTTEVDDADSIEEKYTGGSSSGGHGTAISHEPPVVKRHSQSSQAYALGVLSTRESRRSTIQSIPTNVTPTNATPAPSPYPGTEPTLSGDTIVGAPVVTRSNSVAKKPARKPVPAYNPGEAVAASAPGSKRSSRDGAETDLGPQMISHSQRSDSVLLTAFPFELDGAQGQVHYLIPDPPVSPQR